MPADQAPTDARQTINPLSKTYKRLRRNIHDQYMKLNEAELNALKVALTEENNNLKRSYSQVMVQKPEVPTELDRDVPPKRTDSEEDAGKLHTLREYFKSVFAGAEAAHQFGEAGLFGKVDIISDAFIDFGPKASTLSPMVQEKLENCRLRMEKL